MDDATMYLAELNADIKLLEQTGRPTKHLKRSLSTLSKKMSNLMESRFEGHILPKGAEQ